MESTDLSAVLVALDLLGTFVFALSGGLVAVRKGLDVFGVLVLAGVTGLGGGLVRDVLIGAVPPTALLDWPYLVVPVAAAVACFYFHPALGRLERLILLCDAAGLSLFCITGATKALAFGLGPVPAALMGLITGIGGGVMRDVLSGRVPVVLRSETYYAIPALVGAALAVAGDEAGMGSWSAIPAALICFGWRSLAMWRGWHAPRPAGSAST